MTESLNPFCGTSTRPASILESARSIPFDPVRAVLAVERAGRLRQFTAPAQVTALCRSVESDSPVAERREAIAGDDQMIQQLNVEESACGQRLGRQS